MQNQFKNLLIIVESPTKCKTIAGYLKSYTNTCEVIASYGHVRRLPRKSDSVVPDQSFRMKWEEVPTSAKYIQNIVTSVHRIAKANGMVILATDSDREGEAIAWHIAEILREHKIDVPTKRIVFQEITSKSIRNALSNLADLDKKKVDSYFARLSVDYLVGFKLSPILWTKVKGCKSAGRVQSAALRAIVDRELEIIKFQPQKYWTLSATFQIDEHEYAADLTEWQGKKLEQFMWDEQSVSDACKLLKQNKYSIDKVESNTTYRSPNAPFTTSTLQQEAARRLGWKPSKTLKVAQQLYEGVKLQSEQIGLITYMRTDSTNMNEEAVQQCIDIIKKFLGAEYVQPRQYKSKTENAQNAHEAIRPTSFALLPDSIKQYLQDDLYRLYTLIWCRATASQVSDAEYLVTNVIVGGKDGKWKIHGREQKFDGFLRIIPDESNNDQKIYEMKANSTAICKKVDSNEHMTQPKSRFSESGIIKYMDEAGIGRPSTYASIIDTLEAREYIERQGKKIIPLPKGWLVTGFLTESCPKYIKDTFTAEVEDSLDQIAQGSTDWKSVLNEFWKDFSIILDSAAQVDPKTITNRIANRYIDYFFGGEVKCPKCGEGQKVLCVLNDGSFVGCSNHPNCDWRQSFNHKEAILIGYDPESNAEINLKHGQYGYYLNWSGTKKNIPIPDRMVEKINLETALALGKLPKVLGNHPYTNKEIKLGIGRYGSYVLYNSIYVSCPITNIVDMTFEKAVGILGASKKVKKHEELQK